MFLKKEQLFLGGEIMAVKCTRCQEEIPNRDVHYHQDQQVCEDCYMEVLQRPKTCDVTAVQMAKKHRQASGQTGTEGLLDIQKNIYNYIVEHEKATRQQVMEALDVSELELDKQIAVLRHCELVKGRKEGNQVYLVPYDY